MGLKALITLDLKVTEEQRECFYEGLKKEKWAKIPNLTTAWTCSFQDGVTRQNAISNIESDIKRCKNNCRIQTRIDYAMQIDLEGIVVNNA